MKSGVHHCPTLHSQHPTLYRKVWKKMPDMEAYSDFLTRTGEFEKPELAMGDGDFHPHAELGAKCRPDGTFGEFFGDTVVFELKHKAKEKFAEIIEELYAKVPECFSEKINAGTLHMTLHDLSASENLGEVAADVFNNEIKLIEVLKENPIEIKTVKMKTNFIINMVSKSLVMALVPEDEEEWNKLQTLYSLINQVKVCPYPFLTPHVTLAYFNTNGFGEKSVRKLKKIVEKMNEKGFEVTLHTNKLYYQHFRSMNDYTNIFPLA